jgi:serine/threonine protein kinase
MSLVSSCRFFPAFYGGFVQGDKLYLAMEECSLGTLGYYNVSAAPTTILGRDRKIIMAQLALAINFLHATGIVHRLA